MNVSQQRVRTIAPRLPEIGRLRLGDEKVSERKPGMPLDRFRVTSQSRDVVDAVVEVYGGEIRPWKAPEGDAWQAILAAESLEVIIPPGANYTSSYEQWAAGGCTVRCDGETATVVEKSPIGPVQVERACACDPAERACKITSRLNVILTGVQQVGVFRMETHSYYAAVEMPGVVDLAAALNAYSGFTPASLSIEDRVRKSPLTGTRKFKVPVLRLRVGTVEAFARLTGVTASLPAAVPALGDGSPVVVEPAPDAGAWTQDMDAWQAFTEEVKGLGLDKTQMLAALGVERASEISVSRDEASERIRAAAGF